PTDKGDKSQGPESPTRTVPSTTTPLPGGAGGKFESPTQKVPNSSRLGDLLLEESALYAVVGLQPPKGQGGKGAKGQAVQGPKGVTDDNSNTQFAMLALWAARRHDTPVAAILALSEQRFRASQMDNGAWGYKFHGPDTGAKPSMVCVGLLG